MLDLLKKFENKRPEIVFEWKDSETEAEGWVVINSLRGGAAGGGTRMRKGLDKREVESLAKTMEIKFSVSGPQIGGAKSGINFDPADPRKPEVLQRWFAAVIPLLKMYYGTGGDLNIDEIHEVIPVTESLGLWHPQEGVVNGHISERERDKINVVGQLRAGVSKRLQDEKYAPALDRKLVVADMITGWGVSEATRHYYEIFGGSISGKRVLVQGWGNVGAAAAFYLSQNGAKIVGIIDREGGLMNPDGFTFDEIRTLYLNKDGNKLRAENIIPTEELTPKIWSVGAEVFLPCAASRLVKKEEIDLLIANGLEVISCGANVPFADSEIFFGPIADFVDGKVSLIPDFIANCGMARVFAYLMQPNVEVSDETIFEDTSNTIKSAIEAIHKLSPEKNGIAKRGFEIALRKLGVN